MSARPARDRIKHSLHADHRAGLCRFRVFYLAINERRSVVPIWRLHDTLHRLKLLNLYRTISQLDDGASTRFSVAVHQRTLEIAVSAGTWELRDRGSAPAAPRPF
jgi:hypothetical protein